MPATKLSINYSPTSDIQNLQVFLSISLSDITQKEDTAVSPLQLSKYFLYNRTLGAQLGFGNNVSNYYRYPGGFITTGNRVNSKFSDFTVEQNLTVTLSSNFNTGFNMYNINGNNENRILNVRGINSAWEFAGGGRDDELLTVDNYKKYGYYKGMIMMWSGTYTTLVNNLPFWRLCAPPDAGFDGVNGITIPDLQNRFIMGGSYTPYQSLDDFTPPRTFGLPTVIGNTGGLATVQLTNDQIPTHKHNYTIGFAGGGSSMTAVELNAGVEGVAAGLTFMTGGKILQNNLATSGPTGSAGVAGCGNPCNLLPNNSCFSITTNATQSLPFTEVTVTVTSTPIVITRTSTGNESRGGDASHTNIPPFYALAYIIYVGSAR